MGVDGKQASVITSSSAWKSQSARRVARTIGGTPNSEYLPFSQAQRSGQGEGFGRNAQSSSTRLYARDRDTCVWSSVVRLMVYIGAMVVCW